MRVSVNFHIRKLTNVNFERSASKRKTSHESLELYIRMNCTTFCEPFYIHDENAILNKLRQAITEESYN